MKHLSRFVVTGSLALLLLGSTARPGRAQCWSETAELFAATPQYSGKFGRSVALSGDTLVVGEVNCDFSYFCSPWITHRVHVLERDLGGAGAWGRSRELAISPTPALEPELFGLTVALSGDMLVVGAPAADTFMEGAAYVHERNLGGPDNWGLAALLTPSATSSEGWFGTSVSVSGDTVVVGDLSALSVYVFERNQGGAGAFGETKKLTAAGALLFGLSVAVLGDTLVVGSPQVSNAPGEVHVFERDLGGPGVWGEAHRFEASKGFAGDGFGFDVAIDGDSFVVGAIHAGGNRGAAYVFERDLGGAGSWGEVARLQGSGPSNYDFGNSVAISQSRVLVGTGWTTSPEGSAAYLFERDLGGPEAWGQAQRLTASTPSVVFAEDLAISGDTIVAGSYYQTFGEWWGVEALAFDAGTGLLYGAFELGSSAMSYDPSSGEGTTLGPIGFEKVLGMAFDPNTRTLHATSTKGPDQLLTIDLTSGVGTPVGPIGFKNVQGLAFDPVANVLYGSDRASDQLITIDTATGAGTAVGPFKGGFDEVVGLAFDPLTGSLYGSDLSSNRLLEIDTATGAANVVGGLEYLTSTSLAFDPLTGTLYGAWPNQAYLLEIDTVTGSATPIHGLSVSGAGAAHVFELIPPASYCTAGTSASGCSASLSAVGVPSASHAAGFTLSATGVEGGQRGLFFFGTGGRQANPWGGGTSLQCVAPPLSRGGVMSGQGASGLCDGVFDLDLNARWTSKPGQNPGAGATVQAQLWYTDPLNSSGQAASLSDAVEFCVVP